MIEHSLLIFTLVVIFGFYMAWNIGANDVANAMGTSVGSRAMTLKQAVMVAAVFEFMGAFLVGSSVTQTVKSGIVDINLFSGTPEVVVVGMLSALLAAAMWLQVATIFGWPVSTTHSIIGAVVGFGLVAGGMGVIQWERLTQVGMSWIVSPLSGALISMLIFSFIHRNILATETPVINAKRYTPYLVFILVFTLSLSMIYKGLANLKLPISIEFSILMAIAIGTIGVIISKTLMNKIPDTAYNRKGFGAKFTIVDRIYRSMMILTACYVAFAHGANDVANAIGPVAAVVTTLQTGQIQAHVPVPLWVLAMGGVGIVVGIATMGYRVIDTIGKRITEITPTSGFSATFGTATTVLVCSTMGLPISTTHTLVGSVIGVGLVKGVGSINLRMLWGIVISWIVTVPISAIICALLFKVLFFMLYM
ncbi:phosphate transporter [Desulfurispirillum indicum S5]|uniref:Phosphate transporter n=1 Tax=Desulfurispirillum indicum (strain ATCC BAA-1389 / DSM 22839 / S5) TaxID=653733 RepID=E6W3H1_DESIS|nr:inorganic phosphate transporter [Desulfurispirillum indicum]ADU65764.1 phosphate transporter [Desulfurispirillum indicum S5]